VRSLTPQVAASRRFARRNIVIGHEARPRKVVEQVGKRKLSRKASDLRVLAQFFVLDPPSPNAQSFASSHLSSATADCAWPIVNRVVIDGAEGGIQSSALPAVAREWQLNLQSPLKRAQSCQVMPVSAGALLHGFLHKKAASHRGVSRSSSTNAAERWSTDLPSNTTIPAVNRRPVVVCVVRDIGRVEPRPVRAPERTQTGRQQREPSHAAQLEPGCALSRCAFRGSLPATGARSGCQPSGTPCSVRKLIPPLRRSQHATTSSSNTFPAEQL
jgi:hypothetical protein